MKDHLRTPLLKGKRITERETPREPSGRAGVGESLYRCPRCLRNYWRKSDKAWIKSHCLRTGKDARLIKIRPIDL